MPSKYALIIGNTEYADPGLAKLTAPGKDAEDFARVLKSAELAAFDEVVTFVNEDVFNLNVAIENFFVGKKPDDLLVFYFSGHGVRDESGSLFLAVKNTNRSLLRATAIKADFVRELMDSSRSRRQVIILDCCNSGAFARGTKAEIGGSMGIASAFEGKGYGHIVLTATDSTQFAWEGDKIIGDETANSLFTHFLVKGLEGEADTDGDGKITVDELYDYAYEQIVSRTPKQTPGKWSYKQQGEIILRQSIKIEDIKALPLPEELVAAIDNTIPYVREGAIRQLESLLHGKNLRLARAAKEALEKIAEKDDSRRIAELAAQALDSSGSASTDTDKRTSKDTLLDEKVEREKDAPAGRFAGNRVEEVSAQTVAREAESKDAQIIEPKTPARNLLPFALGGIGLLIIFVLFFVDTYIRSNLQPVPLTPTQSLTSTIATTPTKFTSAVTETPVVTESVPAATETETPTSTKESTLTATHVAPELPIGSTMISDKDGATLVYVPAGSFTMGDNAEDALAECQKYRLDCDKFDRFFKSASPPHKVDLSAFWIDQTEVTNTMYAKCVDAGKCDLPTSADHFGNSGYGSHPVVYVNWNMANAYCAYAGRRLPTEAEWEKAARGTDGRTYPWGKKVDCAFANYYGKGNGKTACIGDTTRVGSYESGKSPYGAYDMAGNVWEWVNDWFDDAYYKNSPPTDPLGSATGESRVLRGGSFTSNFNYLRSAIRSWASPAYSDNYVGFRCAVSQ
jgi:formylglycine-generating enzyme required for sulfatase activity